MSSTYHAFHEKFFQILEDYFGLHFKEMIDKHWPIGVAASRSISAYGEAVARSVVDTLLEELENLDWSGVQASLRQQGGVKAMAEAPVDALFEPRPVQAVSLYADTIALSMHTLHSMDGTRLLETVHNPFGALSHLIVVSLALLQMRELFLADVRPPIAVLVRPPMLVNSQIYRLNEELGLGLCSDAFGKTFSSRSELKQFVRGCETVDALCQEIKKPELFFLSGSLAEDIKKNLEYGFLMEAPRFASEHDPELLAFTISGMLIGKTHVAASQFFSCAEFGAQPLADTRERWQHLRWILEHDNKYLADKLGFGSVSRDSLVLNALQLDGFEWMGNVPTDAVVRMREEGEFQNIRDILGRGIERIEGVSDKDFLEVTKQVGYNLDQEFRRHAAELKAMDTEFRRKYKFDLASVTVGGAIAVMSAMYPPLASLAPFVGSVGPTKTILDVLEQRTRRDELRRKPVALLFQAYQEGQKNQRQ
jgi:hypothetical protein